MTASTTVGARNHPRSGTGAAAPPTRIYVLPFTADPALAEHLRQQSAAVIPQGPVRSLIAARPRVVDAVTGHDRSEPPGAAVARQVAEELAAAGWPLAEATTTPRHGVVLANELFDALPVERFQLGPDGWRRLLVTLDAEGRLQEVAGPSLAAGLLRQLDALGLPADGGGRALGWTSEWCPALAPCLRRMRRGLERGWLLAIDYALTAHQLYAPWRDGGTLLAVQGQQAGAALLHNPGRQDLSAHVCLDAMALAAGRSGWHWHGSALQGEALLGLGLAGELSALSGADAGSLATRLQRREELLRLVDPHLLGGFHWMLLQTEPAEALGGGGLRIWPGWSA